MSLYSKPLRKPVLVSYFIIVAFLLLFFRDHWTSPPHIEERRFLIEQLQMVSLARGIRVSFISGDVHLAAAARLYSYPKKIDPSSEHHHRQKLKQHLPGGTSGGGGVGGRRRGGGGGRKGRGGENWMRRRHEGAVVADVQGEAVGTEAWEGAAGESKEEGLTYESLGEQQRGGGGGGMVPGGLPGVGREARGGVGAGDGSQLEEGVYQRGSPYQQQQHKEIGVMSGCDHAAAAGGGGGEQRGQREGKPSMRGPQTMRDKSNSKEGDGDVKGQLQALVAEQGHPWGGLLGDYRFMAQIVSSAIVNAPPPDILVKVSLGICCNL